jgi:hypothetical protein
MNWISLIGPAMVAAGVSCVIAIVGSVTTARRLRQLQADRLEFDFALAAHKLNLDNTLAAIRAAAERYDRDLDQLNCEAICYVVSLHCRSPEVMLWTAPPPARECHRCGCC